MTSEVFGHINPTHRRHNPMHDYKESCIYHITLVVSNRCQVFGRIVDCREEGVELKKFSLPNGETRYLDLDGTVWTEADLANTAKMSFTPLGKEIQRKIQEIPEKEAGKGNDIQILGACVMPEHIHFVLYVRKPMKNELGTIIRGFKQGCNKILKSYINADIDKEQSPLGTATFLKCASTRIIEGHALFEENYDETRLRRKGQLRAMIDYVHHNPSHRWMRMHKPCWLLPTRGIEIAGRKYDAIGNINLLALPRQQVHCRYIWDKENNTEARRAHQNMCAMKARAGHALVSPFISLHEVAVRDWCLNEGGAIIQLMDNGLSDLAQCPGGLYDYCANGQVLLLVASDWPYIEKKVRCTREECQILNGYAEEIAGE